MIENLAAPRPPAGRPPLSLALLLATLASLPLVPTKHSAHASDPEPLPNVTARPVQLQQVRSSVRLLGTVKPYRSATIGCAVAGRVKELMAKRGDPVSAGDPVAELQTDVVKIEIASARAERRLAEQQLAELTAGSREEDIAEAESLARQFDAAVIAHRRLVAGPRKEQVAQAHAQLDLQAEQVKLLEDRLKKHTIVAPFDGFVTAEHTEAGAWIEAGGPAVDLIELDVVRVEVAVPAPQVVPLRRGQEVRMESEERPNELLVGELEQIVPAADTRARTYPVLIRLENRTERGNPILMSGMLVQVDLPAGPQTEGLCVPTDAIVLNQFRKSVFLVDPDDDEQTGVVREVPVTLGVADGGMIEVRGDLLPGQWVVTQGNERLKTGEQVDVHFSRE